MDKQTKIVMLRAVGNGTLEPQDLTPKHRIIILQAGPDNPATIAAIRQQEAVANKRLRNACGGTGPQYHTAFVIEQD